MRSFALLAYASTYLKVHFPARVLHRAAQQPADGLLSSRHARERGAAARRPVSPDRRAGVGLGLHRRSRRRHSAGAALRRAALREQVGRAIAQSSGRLARVASPSRYGEPAHLPHRPTRTTCPAVSQMRVRRRIDARAHRQRRAVLQRLLASTRAAFAPQRASAGRVRFASVDELVARAGVRRDELVTLADIGALNSFGYDRRSALWQAERAVRPSGELFTTIITARATDTELTETSSQINRRDAETPSCVLSAENSASRRSLRLTSCPLKPMTEAERLVADYAGTGLTIGRHPMALRRDELAMRGVLRACDLHAARPGRRVRVAGMVITRQRPGTAKGFVFLTLEDETGIANIIVRPDLFARDRLVIVEEPFLIVDGVLQNQDGVTSVRAEQVQGMRGVDVDFDAHDFY